MREADAIERAFRTRERSEFDELVDLAAYSEDFDLNPSRPARFNAYPLRKEKK